MNLEGEKISTSKNWAIWVDEFVKDFDGEYLRYYLAVNAPEKQDSDFSFKGFQACVNSDLNNTLGNLANRVFAFAAKNYEGIITACELDEQSKAVISETNALICEIESGYKDYQVKKNTRLVMDIARLGNRYFDERKPWSVIKSDRTQVNETLYVCVNLLAKLSIAFTPILPKHMKQLRQMMNLSLHPVFADAYPLLEGSIQLGETKPLFRKLEDEEIEKQLELLKASSIQAPAIEYAAIKESISYEDFAKLDIRLAKVLSAEAVPKTEKLLKLKVDIGSETRELIAGIAQSYEPKDLVGKLITMLVNLEPRKIRGVMSQGMILAAHTNGEIKVMIPDGEGSPGSVVQ
jgi:methionyl-tRNA synthetase